MLPDHVVCLVILPQPKKSWNKSSNCFSYKYVIPKSLVRLAIGWVSVCLYSNLHMLHVFVFFPIPGSPWLGSKTPRDQRIGMGPEPLKIPKINMPWKGTILKGKYMFQPSIFRFFRGYASFQGGIRCFSLLLEFHRWGPKCSGIRVWKWTFWSGRKKQTNLQMF